MAQRFYILLVLPALSLLFSSCDHETTGLEELLVTCPVTGNEVWERKQGLPEFNPELHSDGCSGGMSKLYSKLTFLHPVHGNELRWRECCVIHDKAYYYGGSKAEKEKADQELRTCVTGIVGNDFLGKLMEAAVDIGGGPYLPAPFRWGYGEDFRDQSEGGT